MDKGEQDRRDEFMQHEDPFESVARHAEAGIARASGRRDPFSAIMCRKFADVAALSWHLPMLTQPRQASALGTNS
jgi:hypothetical protein